MVRTSLLLVCVLFYASAEGRRFFGSCPKVSTENVDNRLMKGTWYAYAINPSKWIEECFIYEITSNDNSEYHLKEKYLNSYKVFKTTTTNEYELDNNVASPNLVLRRKVAKFIPSTEIWQLAKTDEYKSYLILHRCGATLPWWQKEEVQVWVRDENLVSGQEVPGDITAALTAVGFKLNELQFKKQSDCSK